MTFRVDKFAFGISSPKTKIQERVYFIIQIRQFCVREKSVIDPNCVVYCSGDDREVTIAHFDTCFVVPFHFLDIQHCSLHHIKTWFIDKEEKATIERIERYSNCVKEAEAYLITLEEKLRENNIPL